MMMVSFITTFVVSLFDFYCLLMFVYCSFCLAVPYVISRRDTKCALQLETDNRLDAKWVLYCRNDFLLL